jgi:glucose-1-phosphate cytidylyltransferase
MQRIDIEAGGGMARARTPKEQLPVVILAGGMGTRLREETERVPKPLVEIGQRPILWHIMKLYASFDVTRFVLCLGYKSWLIKQFFLSHREQMADFTIRLSDDHEPVFHNDAGHEDWEVTCIETGLLTATGSRIKRVQDYVDTDTFLLTYGDGLGQVDVDALLEHHYAQGRIGTVTGVHPTSRYGEMRIDGHQVVEFNEKPTQPEGYVSGGFFVFEREFFDYLDEDDADQFLEHAPLQKLARAGELSVYPHQGFWLGMDTYRDFTLLNELWESGQAPWKVWD